MARRSRFSQDVRERAVRMVIDHKDQYASEWEAMSSVARKIGCSAETLRKWVRQSEVVLNCASENGLSSETCGRLTGVNYFCWHRQK